MSNIDDFLERIVNQHQEKQNKLNNKQYNSNLPNNSSAMNSEQNSIDAYLSQLETEKKEQAKPIESDNLFEEVTSNDRAKKHTISNSTDLTSSPSLADIENKFQQQKQKQNSNLSSSPSLADIENKFKQQKQKQTNNSISLSSLSDLENKFKQTRKKQNLDSKTSSVVDNSLEQIVENTKSKIKNTQAQKTSHNLEDIRLEELNKQKQIKLLTSKAKIWLKNLDPVSEEGFWFEEFALSYPSKLEAAIDYLKALDPNLNN